jgi:nucleotide-binding universal stress UspA family protein
MYKAILVAYDGSTAAAHIFHSAVELAERLDAIVGVVSVAQLPKPATMVETSAILDSAKTQYEKVEARRPFFSRLRLNGQRQNPCRNLCRDTERPVFQCNPMYLSV